MKHLSTEVLVIGGGATGTGLARDLTMRGYQTILVEKSDLSTGTTGRYHGLLHSGGRYVVNDPEAAKECIQENIILKKIIPFAIEDTGGFFVSTPWDDPEYANLFLSGCQSAGIPVEQISTSQLLQIEPMLNREISHCFRVPDASADSFLASQANAWAAQALGAKILTYHVVTDLLKQKDAIVGAVCQDLHGDETVEISADFVINASGAWAGKIAEKAGIRVRMIPGKGTMIALNHRVINTVINRCKYPSDGDIIVPAHSVAILGTTDHPVPDPDVYTIEDWEVKKIIEEGEKLIPGLKQMRFLRAWAGVRPLYKESDTNDTRDITRAFVLLDHETRDGVSGFITITCGKWTTYRKMAEVTVDLLCKKLSTLRRCRTHLEPLENPEKKHSTQSTSSLKNIYHQLGNRLKFVEKNRAKLNLICECELVTKDDVYHAIQEGRAKTIDDIRRQTRLGMGPCQGGFCTIRAVGIFHEETKQPVLSSNQLLHDFLAERQKGVRPILWGDQLKQALFDELIFKSILNVENLPLPEQKKNNPENQFPPVKKTSKHSRLAEDISLPSDNNQPTLFSPNKLTHKFDVVVIGAGLAGLVSAWRLSKRGVSVCVVSVGWGAPYWHTGCVDLIGYSFNGKRKLIRSPLNYLDNISEAKTLSDHPYIKVDRNRIESVVNEFKHLCSENGYPFIGTADENVSVIGAIGVHRPTCLVPQTMAAGILRPEDKLIVVGFENYPDFYPKYIADNLIASGIDAQYKVIKISQYSPETNLTDRRLSQWFSKPEFRDFIVSEINSQIQKKSSSSPVKVGLPAVLGSEASLETFNQVQQKIEAEIFEIPTLPPSIPGIRLSKLLAREVKKNGGQVFLGMKAVSYEGNDHRIHYLLTESAAGLISHKAETFILATGGILGGGIFKPYDQPLREIVFNLPVKINQPITNNQKYDTTMRHPAFSAGILTNDQFQPIDEKDVPLFNNLYCVGTELYGGDYIHERSFDGVGLVTGFSVGENIQ
jgi:glycerol-3-phosphate dehydrogenase